MNIGVIAPGPRTSGASRVAWAHAEALASRDHAVVVVAQGDGRASASERRSRAVLLSQEEFQNAGRVLEAAGECDVLHVHRGGELESDLVPLAAQRYPVVLTLHGAPAPERGQQELATARRVVFPSLTHLVRTRDRFELSADAVRLMPHGLVGDPPAKGRRPRAWRGKGALALLHIGERTADSGLLDLAEALGMAAAQDRSGQGTGPGRLRLVSRGEVLEAEFDDELRAAAEGSFEIDLGPSVDSRGLAEIATECHLAVLPSRRPESYSLELDDVVAAGLPAWLTFGAVAGERFERSVFEDLPSAEPAAWASALGELLRDPGRLARAFTALPDRVPAADVESLLHLYEGALAEHRSAA